MRRQALGASGCARARRPPTQRLPAAPRARLLPRRGLRPRAARDGRSRRRRMARLAPHLRGCPLRLLPRRRRAARGRPRLRARLLRRPRLRLQAELARAPALRPRERALRMASSGACSSSAAGGARRLAPRCSTVLTAAACRLRRLPLGCAASWPSDTRGERTPCAVGRWRMPAAGLGGEGTTSCCPTCCLAALRRLTLATTATAAARC